LGVLRRHASLIAFLRRILDIALVILVTALIGQMYGPPELARALAIYGSLLTLLFFSYLDLYRSFRQKPIFAQLRQLFFAWLCVVIAVNILILLLANKAQLEILWPAALFGTPVYQMWIVLCFSALAVVRILTSLFLFYIRKGGYNKRTAIIIGYDQTAQNLGRHIHENQWMGTQVLGYFTEEDYNIKANDKGKNDTHAPVIGTIEDCVEYTHTHKPDIAFITLEMRYQKTIMDLIWDIGTKGVAVYIIPNLLGLGIQKAKIVHMGSLPLIDLNLYPKWKRPFDIIFSLLIIVLTLPLWLAIIIFIKTTDKGPVFYRDPRIGENGRQFKCWKFRTMHVDADKKLEKLLEQDEKLKKEYSRTYKLKSDPRVTPIGRFLRKTSLDELPQFLNVIIGEMSVVGARPVLPPQFINHYRGIALTYCSTKPGITGPWQVGKRSDTDDFMERCELDQRYVLSCTFWQDIKIISRTIWRVLRPKGAY